MKIMSIHSLEEEDRVQTQTSPSNSPPTTSYATQLSNLEATIRAAKRTNSSSQAMNNLIMQSHLILQSLSFRMSSLLTFHSPHRNRTIPLNNKYQLLVVQPQKENRQRLLSALLIQMAFVWISFRRARRRSRCAKTI